MSLLNLNTANGILYEKKKPNCHTLQYTYNALRNEEKYENGERGRLLNYLHIGHLSLTYRKIIKSSKIAHFIGI